MLESEENTIQLGDNAIVTCIDNTIQLVSLTLKFHIECKEETKTKEFKELANLRCRRIMDYLRKEGFLTTSGEWKTQVTIINKNEENNSEF